MTNSMREKIVIGLIIYLSACLLASTIALVCCVNKIGNLKKEIATVSHSVDDDNRKYSAHKTNQ